MTSQVRIPTAAKHDPSNSERQSTELLNLNSTLKSPISRVFPVNIRICKVTRQASHLAGRLGEKRIKSDHRVRERRQAVGNIGAGIDKGARAKTERGRNLVE